jgi:hypothetical protein
MSSIIAIISKEEVPGFSFVTSDVLQDSALKKARENALLQAMVLGNGYKGKVRITFDTTQGTKAVETTVWHATEKNIALKGGTVIPVHAIREVKLV